jgi:4'-phosphopantetheinyl transferase EntD
VEEVGRFRPDLVPQVLSPREIEANLREFPCRQKQLERTAVIFSAKESLYKCLHPLTQLPLEFHDIEVVLYDCSASFEIKLQAQTGRFGSALVGRYAVKGDLVATAMTLSCAARLPESPATATANEPLI